MTSLPAAVVPLQLDALFSLPGILGALILVAVVILVARIVLKVAWKITLVAVVIAAILWFLGMLGPLSELFGVGG